MLPADGKRSVILYLHGGAFLTCGANSHGRLVTALSRFADSPALVVNYRMIPKHSIGEAIDDCYDAYKWLRLKGYEPEQIVLAGDSAGGYLSLALAERLHFEGELPAAVVTMSPLFEIDNDGRAQHPNTHSDAMFPPKAFEALVELIEGAAKRHVVDGEPEQVYEPLDHIETGSAAHPDPRFRFRGSAQRCAKGRAHARRGGRSGRSARLAWSDARLPVGGAGGQGGDAVAEADRRLHPRGHLVTRIGRLTRWTHANRGSCQ